MTASTTTAARSNTSTTTVSLRRQRRKRTTTTVSRAMMNLRFDDDDGKKNSNDEEKTMSKRQFALSTAAAVASVVLSLGQPMDAQALSLKSSNKNGVYWIEPKVFIVWDIKFLSFSFALSFKNNNNNNSTVLTSFRLCLLCLLSNRTTRRWRLHSPQNSASKATRLSQPPRNSKKAPDIITSSSMASTWRKEPSSRLTPRTCTTARRKKKARLL